MPVLVTVKPTALPLQQHGQPASSSERPPRTVAGSDPGQLKTAALVPAAADACSTS